MIRSRQTLRGKTLLIEVCHVNELIARYIKMLDLLELDLPNQSYGQSNSNKSQPSPFAWMLIYDTNTTNFEGKNNFDLSVPCE